MTGAPSAHNSEARSVGTGLPAELTSFIGRDQELAAIGQLLDAVRLVTLTGVGGSGKTRLALRVAADIGLRFRHGTVVVELAGLSDASVIPQAILQALGAGDLISPSVESVTQAALLDVEMLLVLDNCEHLAEGCAALVETVLRASPGLRVLATSREPLNADGEVTFPVPPLALPPDETSARPDELARFDAIRLFADRAAAVRPDFVIDQATADPVARLCRRLDGLPLALELAASRMRSMSATEILGRIDDRFSILRRAHGRGPSRHQTLRATIDWSHNLLTEAERILFRRLSVFAGGWTLADAEHIASADPLARDDVVELHARLVDRSLVVAEPAFIDTTRYRLLETLRQYAAERLAEAGETEQLRQRHLEHFLALAEDYDLERRSRGSDAGLPLLASQRDNFRAALDWATAIDAQAALRLTAVLDDFWRMVSAAEGWHRLQQTLEAAPKDSPYRLRALLTAGMLAAYIPAYAEGTGLLRDVLAAAESHGDRVTAGWAELWLGRLAFFSGNPQTAEDHLLRALEAHEALDSPLGLVRSLGLLGLLRAVVIGHRADGMEKLERAVGLARDVGDSWGEGYASMMLAICAADAGDFDRTASNGGVALRASTLGPLRGVALQAIAQATVGRNPSRAARLLGAADGHFQRTTTVPPPFLRQRHDEVRGRVEHLLGVEAATRAWDDGRRMTIDEAVAFALADPHTAPTPASVPLSHREAEVATLVARGRTNREIADALRISVRTAESHLNHILTKLDLRNRTEIAGWAGANLTDPAR